MGLLGTIFKTAIDVVTIPIDAVVDVVEIFDGGEAENLSNKARKLGGNVGDAIDDIRHVDLL